MISKETISSEVPFENERFGRTFHAGFCWSMLLKLAKIHLTSFLFSTLSKIFSLSGSWYFVYMLHYYYFFSLNRSITSNSRKYILIYWRIFKTKGCRVAFNLIFSESATDKLEKAKRQQLKQNSGLQQIFSKQKMQINIAIQNDFFFRYKQI